MKKLLLLFAVMLTTVGAWAQPTTGKFYQLKAKHDSYIVYADATNHRLKPTAPANSNTDFGSNQLWYLEESPTEGKYTLRNMSNRYYMKAGSEWYSSQDFNDVYIVERTAASGGNPAYYNISSVSDASGRTCLHCWASSEGVNWEGDGGGSQFAFVEVEFEQSQIYDLMYSTETGLIDYTSKIHNGDWQNESSGWHTGIVSNDYVSVTLSSTGNYVGISTKESIKRPWLQAGQVYTISIPDACKITEYKIVTQSTTAGNQSTFKYTTSEGMGTSPTQTTSNQELHVTGLNTSSITLDLSDYTVSGTNGILLYNLYIKYKYEEVVFAYSFKFDGKKVKHEFISGILGWEFPQGALPAYCEYVQKDGNITTEDRGKTFEFNVTTSLPFEVSEDYATAKWYYMNLRGNTWVAHSDNPPYSNRKERYPDIYGQWAFIGNPFDGIQVLNRGAGDGKTLGYDGLTDHSNIHMKDGTTTWNITEGNGGFALHMGAGTNNYIHDYNSKLQIWKDDRARTDAGSAFQVEAVEEYKFHQIWGNHYPWTTEVLAEVPDGVVDCQYHDDGYANIRMAQTKIIAEGGDVTVLFQYASGSHMLMIVGVDIVKDGIVVKKDYHEGKTAGSTSSNNTYTLSGVEAGEYTLRYFVCQKTSGDNSHNLTLTNGNITVDGAKRANVDVKYVFTIDGVEKVQSDPVSRVPGEVYPDITNEFPYGIRVTKPSGAIVDADIVNGTVTKTIQMEEVLPFNKSASFEDATWFLVDMHSNDTGTPNVVNGTNTYVWTYVPESETNNVQLPQEARKQNALFTDNKLWCFVGNAYDGFKIYNKAAGDGLTLNKPLDGNTVAKMTDANATLYEIRESSIIDGAVCFLPKGHTYYLNTQKNDGLGVKVLQGHNVNDGGSSCRFFAPTHFVKDAILAEFDPNMPECAVGSKVAMTKECYNALAESLQSIQADGWNTSAVTEGVTEYLDALQASERIQIQDGGYYFVKGTGDGNNASWYLSHSVQNDQNSLWAKAPDMLNADYIWKFEAVEDGYKVQSANLGKYFQLKTATNGGDNNTYVTETFEQGNKMYAEGVSGTVCKFIIKNSNNANMRTEAGGQVNYWSGETSESWYIIPATELDIEVTSAGWATTCLPFDVVLPEELTAYALTDVSGVSGEETGSVSLISKAGIKAYEGALLKGEEGTYTLSIEETSSNWDANLLSGTTVAKDMSAVEGDVYLLASDGAGSAQLSKLDLADNATEAKKTLAANKAYLEIAPSTTRFLVFNFGDDNATAIENILGAENATDAVVYDLAGRRVQNAQKGIFIVNGKKVVK